MQIKYGINFSEHNILLLNEIQYSKNILNVFHDLIQDTSMKTTIIATGIIQKQSSEYKLLYESGAISTLTIQPLGFFDFLNYKGIHTTYLTLNNPSPIMFKEIQGLLDEYLTRGGYPEVVKATSKERKEFNLKAIIQKVYDKDV